MNDEILERATAAFYEETGRKAKIRKKEVRQGDMVIDAVLELDGECYNAEIKRWAQQANFGALVYQIKQLPEKGILIADYINRKMAKRLKEAGVYFIDTAGNAYLDQPNLFLNVKGNDPLVTLTVKRRRKPPITINIGKNKKIRPEQKERTGRAFTPTGLKVAYQFLRDPQLVGAPYREIADKADVALGTVGWVINDLKAQGIVVERGKTKRIREARALLDTWVETYPLKLRPKCFIGNFFQEDPYWWREQDIMKVGGQWGGETAAALLTNYLKPQKATIFLRGDVVKLVQDARLTKANRIEDANVEVLTPFWKNDEPGNIVCPLVVYADLIATGDPRNLETADIIYEQFVDQYLRKAR